MRPHPALVIALNLANYLLAWVASNQGILQPWHMGVLVLNTGVTLMYLGTLHEQRERGRR